MPKPTTKAQKKVLDLRKGKDAEKGAAEQLANQLVELHFTRGAIADTEKEFYAKSAELDYEGTKKVLEMRKGKETVDAHLHNLGAGMEGADANDRKNWKYLDWYKKDLEGLETMKNKEPEKHAKLHGDYMLELRKSGDYILDDKEA